MSTPYEDLPHCIDGEFVRSGRRREQNRFGPATDRPIGHLPPATPAGLDRVLAATQHAVPAGDSVEVRGEVALERDRTLAHHRAPLLGLEVAITPETSPSEISMMRAPAARTCATSSA